MNNIIYNLCGKTKVRIKNSALQEMSLPDLISLIVAQQKGQIDIEVDENA
jgi:hypothetical protein